MTYDDLINEGGIDITPEFKPPSYDDIIKQGGVDITPELKPLSYNNIMEQGGTDVTSRFKPLSYDDVIKQGGVDVTSRFGTPARGLPKITNEYFNTAESTLTERKAGFKPEISSPTISTITNKPIPTTEEKFRQSDFITSAPATAAGIMTSIPTGIAAGYVGLLRLATTGDLDKTKAMMDEINAQPGKFIKTPEQQKVVENISKVLMYLPEKGKEIMGKIAEAELRRLSPEDQKRLGAIKPIMETAGEFGVLMAFPLLKKAVAKSTWFRMLANEERSLVVQSLGDAIRNNPKMTEGEILRKWDNPSWRQEALLKRAIGETPQAEPMAKTVPKTETTQPPPAAEGDPKIAAKPFYDAFKTNAEAGTDIPTLIAGKNKIVSQFPHLEDDLNKIIIDAQAAKPMTTGARPTMPPISDVAAPEAPRIEIGGEGIPAYGPEEQVEPSETSAPKERHLMGKDEFIQNAKNKIGNKFYPEGSPFGTEAQFVVSAAMAHREFIKQALISGSFTPSEARDLHKTAYPDIEAWPEMKAKPEPKGEAIKDLAPKPEAKEPRLMPKDELYKKQEELMINNSPDWDEVVAVGKEHATINPKTMYRRARSVLEGSPFNIVAKYFSAKASTGDGKVGEIRGLISIANKLKIANANILVNDVLSDLPKVVLKAYPDIEAWPEMATKSASGGEAVKDKKFIHDFNSKNDVEIVVEMFKDAAKRADNAKQFEEYVHTSHNGLWTDISKRFEAEAGYRIPDAYRNYLAAESSRVGNELVKSRKKTASFDFELFYNKFTEMPKPEAKGEGVVPDLTGNKKEWDALADEVIKYIEDARKKPNLQSWEENLLYDAENEIYSVVPLARDALTANAENILFSKLGYKNRSEHTAGDVSERLRQSIISRKDETEAKGEVGEAPAATQLPTKPPVSVGKTSKSFTPDNKEIETKYGVYEIGDLIASHNENFSENKIFPKELQPRDRDRPALKLQIESMANNITPGRLGESSTTTNGAPIIGSDAVVESGNGRVVALLKAYKNNKAENYRNWLIENAEIFGLDKSAVEKLKAPVLIRTRITDTDRSEFVRISNQSYEGKVELPAYTISENGALTKSSRKAYIDTKQRSLFDEGISDSELRSENAPAEDEVLHGREVSDDRGNVLPVVYKPERGTLPEVRSKPIGAWKSSRSKITTPEDAAVIARDNIGTDAQESLFSLVTDESGKILAINQHAVGGPSAANAYPAILSGQALNTPEAQNVWLVHNHPGGDAKTSEADLSVWKNLSRLLDKSGIEAHPIIAITPQSYSQPDTSVAALPTKKKATYDLNVYGRKFDQHPEGLPQLTDQFLLREFGEKYLPGGGIILVDNGQHPVAIIEVSDYSKLKPSHLDVLKEAEKRNASGFMVYDKNKTLSSKDMDNLIAFGNSSMLGLVTAYDKRGDHADAIAARRATLGGTQEFYSINPEAGKQNITLEDVQKIFKGQESWEGPEGTIFIKTRGGGNLAIMGVDHISVRESNFRMGYARNMKEGERLVGAYGRGEGKEDWLGVVKLLKDAAGQVTLAHESAHFMEDFGIINSLDVATLKGHIKRLVKDGKLETANNDDIGGPEDRANFLADALTSDKAPKKGFIARILERIKEFIDRLFNAFGKRTAGGVVRDIGSGKIFDRAEGAAVPEEGRTEGVAEKNNQYSVQKKEMPGSLFPEVNKLSKQISTGFSGLGKMAKSGTLDAPAELDDVLEHIKATEAGETEYSPEDHPDAFALLSYLVARGGTGSRTASTIFKAIVERNALIQQAEDLNQQGLFKEGGGKGGEINLGLLTLGTTKFIQEDVVPTSRAIRSIISQSAKDIRDVFSPASTEKGAETAAIMRKNLAEMARSTDRAQFALEKARSYFASKDPQSNYEFMDSIETGGTYPDRVLSDTARIMRGLLDRKADEVRALGTGKLQQAIENYFPHIWQDPVKANQAFQNWYAKRPMEGGKSFLKKRTIPTTKEGLGMGLVPISNNPVDLVLLKLREMDKYIMAQKTLKSMKDRGLAIEVPVFGKAPDGYVQINDKIAKVYGGTKVTARQVLDEFAKGTRYDLFKDQFGKAIFENELTKAEVPEIFHAYRQKGQSYTESFMKEFVRGPEDFAAKYPNVFELFQKSADIHPELQRLFTIPKFTDETLEMPVGGLIIKGQYYAPADAARVINNYLSPGLRGNQGFRAYLGAANILNQVQLGLSAFHLGFTSLDAMISKTALALNQASHGDIVRAGRSFMETPIAPVSNILRGRKLRKEWLMPGTQDAGIGKLVNAVIEAGGRVKMDRFYATEYAQKAADAFRSGNIIGGIIRTPFALVDLFAKPIMEYIVPLQKLGVFADLARYELERLEKAGASEKEIQIALLKIWDSVDNRMGQLVYDNLFWNKTMKDMGMASVRSLGWNLGTIREIGGGVVDFTKEAAGAFKGKKPDMTYRMAYTVALPIVTGIIGATIGYLMTGERPKELKDYFFPKTGKLDEAGRPARLSMPSYIKDLVHYYEQPIQTVVNKLHPLLSMIGQMLENEDFYGVEIADWSEGAIKTLLDQKTYKDYMEYFGKSVTPFGIRNLMRERELGGSITDQALPFIGMTPAPAAISKSKAEKMMSEILRGRMPSAAITKKQSEIYQAKGRVLSAMRRGKDCTPEDAELLGENLSRKQIKNMDKDLRRGLFLKQFSMLTIEEALDVYESGAPDEKEKAYPILRKKIHNVMRHNKEKYIKLYDKKIKPIIEERAAQIVESLGETEPEP